jgi:hypothetical protein
MAAAASWGIELGWGNLVRSTKESERRIGLIAQNTHNAQIKQMVLFGHRTPQY